MQHTKDVEILRSSNDSLLREKEHAEQELSRLQERFTAADRRHSAAMKEHGAIRVRRSPHLARPTSLAPPWTSLRQGLYHTGPPRRGRVDPKGASCVGREGTGAVHAASS